jgi:hypothetical protein
VLLKALLRHVLRAQPLGRASWRAPKHIDVRAARTTATC